MLIIKNYKSIVGKEIITANGRSAFKVTSCHNFTQFYEMTVVDTMVPQRTPYSVILLTKRDSDKKYSVILDNDKSEIKLDKSDIQDIDVVLRTISYLIDEYKLKQTWNSIVPKVNKVKAQTIASQLVSVQPMNPPTGIVYAPYIPVMNTPTVTASSNASGSLVQRYAKKIINNSFFGKIKITK